MTRAYFRGEEIPARLGTPELRSIAAGKVNAAEETRLMVSETAGCMLISGGKTAEVIDFNRQACRGKRHPSFLALVQRVDTNSLRLDSLLRLRAPILDTSSTEAVAVGVDA